MRFHILAHTIGALGGLLLVVCPFTRRARSAAGFLRIQILLAGIVTIAWSTIGLYLFSHETEAHRTLLPWAQYWHLMLFRWTLSGAVLALLITMLINPQFRTWLRAGHNKA